MVQQSFLFGIKHVTSKPEPEPKPKAPVSDNSNKVVPSRPEPVAIPAPVIEDTRRSTTPVQAPEYFGPLATLGEAPIDVAESAVSLLQLASERCADKLSVPGSEGPPRPVSDGAGTPLEKGDSQLHSWETLRSLGDLSFREAKLGYVATGFLVSQAGGYEEVEHQELTSNPGDLAVRMQEEEMLSLEALIARMGAKSKLREELVGWFPKTHTYVEPFGGSFKVLLWKKHRHPIEIINDFDGDVVSFYKAVRDFGKVFADFVNNLPTHEAMILGLRDELKGRKLYALERAAAFYLGSQSAFNAKGDYSSYASSPQARLDLSIDEHKVRLIQARLKGVDIRSTGYERVITSANKRLDAKAYPPGKVFFYLDPPYWETTGYKTFQGASSFGWSDQVNLARLCREIHEAGNLFIQTNSAHQDLIPLYKDFKITKRDVYYSMSGDAEAREAKGEYIISNFDILSNVKQTSMFGGLK